MVLGLEAIGNVFSSFFDFIVNNILLPIVVLFFVGLFFVIQYIFIKMYAWVFTGGLKTYKAIRDSLFAKNFEKTLENLFG